MRPPPPARTDVARPRGRAAVVVPLFGALLFTLGCVGFAEMILRDLLLRWAGETTTAEVTDSRQGRRGRRSVNSPYTLQYRFLVPGSPGAYAHTDLFTHREASVGVSRPVWEAARQTGKLRVQYLPTYPKFNRPADHTPLDGLWCPATGLALMGFFAGVFWWDVAARWRRRTTRPRDPS